MLTKSILQFLLSGGALAASLGYTSLDVQVGTGSKSIGSLKDPVTMKVEPGDELLLTGLQIGSNRDTVLVAVDTGSEYLWIMDSDVTCQPRPNQKRSGLHKRDPDCKAGGTFGKSNSNTFQLNTTRGEFDVEYLSGEKTQGVWGSDDLVISGNVVNDFTFGVASQTSSDIGVLGLSFPERSKHGYSLSRAMLNQGITNRNAYSVFLNERTANSGSILFGAVDHSKYYDQLQTVPILYDPSFPEIKVNVLGIDVALAGQTVSGPVGEKPYVLDTGSTRSRLPAEYKPLLEQMLGGSYDNTWHGIRFDDCSKLDSMSFSVIFDGKVINVPAKSMDYGTQAGNCMLQLNFDDQDDDTLILGIDALRNMYVVVDLGDKEVSVAQARYSDNQDIEVFPPPELNRTTTSRGKSEEQVSSANSIFTSTDVFICLAVLLSSIL